MPPAPTRRSARRPARRSRPALPRGYHTVTPSLAVVGGVEAIEFYKRAFGAKELSRELAPTGKLVLGRLRIGDSTILLSDVFGGSDRAAPSTVATTTVTLHIYTPDLETMWNRAVDAGAKVTAPLEDQYWGERYGHLVDPFGHHWALSMPIRMSKAVRDEKRRVAMRAFAKDEHPDKVPTFTDI
jgi:PhnB protein